MNNLLRTLTESTSKSSLSLPESDLKLLLTTVKKQSFDPKPSSETRATDPFYDSLEELLTDLRTVTVDNHDAEPFLKPVSKAEAPDYYDVIPHPMDLQTMLKKVKSKTYKSKAEFKDDLDLIWSNCFVYNASETHPLRLAATRLQKKSTHLLKNITDRRDRLDFSGIERLVGGGGVNGVSGSVNGGVNGVNGGVKGINGVNGGPNGLGRRRSPSLVGGRTTITIKPQVRSTGSVPPRSLGVSLAQGKGQAHASTSLPPHLHPPGVGREKLGQTREKAQMKDMRDKAKDKNLKGKERELPFEETFAIVRDVEGMRKFWELDLGLEGVEVSTLPYLGVGGGGSSVGGVYDGGVDGGWSSGGVGRVVERLREVVGEDGIGIGEFLGVGEGGEGEGEGGIGGGGVVGEKRRFGTTPDSNTRPHKRPRTSSPSFQISQEESTALNLWWSATLSNELIGNGLPPLVLSSSPPTPTLSKLKKEKRKKKGGKPKGNNEAGTKEPNQKSILTLMNSNIKTMKHVRRTHAKLSALSLTTNQPASAEDGPAPAPLPPPPPVPMLEEREEGDVVDSVDERVWSVWGLGVEPRRKGGRGRGMGMGKGKGKQREEREVEVGEARADECLHWAGGKILEHVGFQGTTKVALDVLAGVTSEYLLNVGRTMRFLCDRYSRKMSAEEIILHTLFESGTSKISDLERYIKDDVLRYGSRLGELEKKLVNVYTEATADEALDDDALFGEEDEEEDSAFVMGNFADALGDDFLGLRELGIADEFGLSSLAVPKRLLKGKKGEQKVSVAVKPTEPPLPFPLPPPFIALDSTKIDEQIGLLRPYYHQRISSIQPTQPPPTFPYPGPPNPVSVTLPDDLPTTQQTKLGPLGQVMKPNASGGTTKKKVKAKEAQAAAAAPMANGVMSPVEGEGNVPPSAKSPKKGGPGRKKKVAVVADAVVAAVA
ncbi:hypothetical protein JAAARDRAFT_208033 [Jaapia argillacea MUCL 33604]|uniref:Bromo domain-containing protein n=1 Tax=Jaapia argillacea MUCL 33604 TaxID=933084 RepID=A0A067PNF9_9AGAM|nr:hypothetical protein JAAARDRAFT_208033 [Jaapia argillacea MUCL 33604]